MKISLEQRLRAAAGPPAYIKRLRRIEDMQAALAREAARLRAEAEGEEAFRARLFAIDLAPLNDLIDRHNQYYPIEANLPMDVKTGRLLDGEAFWRPMPRATHAALLAAIAAAA